MNEQNGSLNQENNTNPVQNQPNTQPEFSQPVQVMENIKTINPGVIPNPEPIQPTPLPVEPTPVPVEPTPVPVEPTPVPVEPVAPITPVQPVVPAQESVPTPQPIPQPVQPVAPVQQPEPVQPEAPTVTPTPVAPAPETVQTAVQPVQQPVTEEVIPQPTPTVQAQVQEQALDINGQPITPTALNNPTTDANNNVVFGPSKPMNEQNNVTNIGFVPAGQELPKKKNKKVKIAIAIIILLGLVAVGYFVVYPYIVKNFMNDPKNVYSATINGAFKQINTTISDVVHEKAIYDIELSLDSNLEVLAPYSGYKYGINAGIDPTKQNLQLGYSIKTPANLEYSAYTYIKDQKVYERYSNYRDSSGKIGLIFTGNSDSSELDSIFATFQEALNSTSNISKEDLNYLTDKLATILVDSIDENKLSKEDASITINKETLKATNNKYTFDKENKIRTIKYIVENLTKDDKAMEIIAKISETDIETIKSLLDVNAEEMVTNDNTTYFNIYTYGRKNDIIGYAITDSSDEVELHYYKKDDNYFEGYLYLVSDNEETGKKEESVIEIIGEEDTTTIKYNNKEIIILNIKTWDDNTIDFDYTLKDTDGDITGKFKYSKDLNKDRLKITLDFSIQITKDEHLSVNFTFTEDWTSEVANINTSATGSVATLTEEEIESVRNNFMNEVYKTSIGTLFQTVSGMYTPEINDYYDNDIDYSFDDEDNTTVIPNEVTPTV